MTVSWWHCWRQNDCVMVRLLKAERLCHGESAEGRVCHGGTAEGRMSVMVGLLKAEWLFHGETAEGRVCHGRTAEGRMTVSWWNCWWQNDCVMVGQLKAPCVHHGVVLVVLLCLLSVHPWLFLLSSCFVICSFPALFLLSSSCSFPALFLLSSCFMCDSRKANATSCRGCWGWRWMTWVLQWRTRTARSKGEVSTVLRPA